MICYHQISYHQSSVVTSAVMSIYFRHRNWDIFILWMTEELICPLKVPLKELLKEHWKAVITHVIPLMHTETRFIYPEPNTDSSQSVLALVGFNLLVFFSVSMEFLHQDKVTAVRVMDVDISWSFFLSLSHVWSPVTSLQKEGSRLRCVPSRYWKVRP